MVQRLSIQSSRICGYISTLALVDLSSVQIGCIIFIHCCILCDGFGLRG